MVGRMIWQHIVLFAEVVVVVTQYVVDPQELLMPILGHCNQCDLGEGRRWLHCPGKFRNWVRLIDVRVRSMRDSRVILF